MRVPALLLVAFLAGCVGSDDAPEPSEPAPEPLPAFDQNLFLHEDMRIDSAPGTGVVALEWSWTEWLRGTMPPLWESAPAEQAYVITSANVTLSYEPGLPVLPTTAVRPQFTMWFGAGDSIIEHGFQAGPEVWTGQETVTFPVDSLPLGGLVVEVDEPLVLYAGVYYPGVADAGSGSLVLDASSIEMQGRYVDLPPAGPSVTTTGSFELEGGRCVADLNQLGTAMESLTFEVPANATRVDARIDRTGTLGGPDLDFFLTDGEGQGVAYAAGPSTPEALHVRAPNLALAAPGTWTLTTYNCQPQVSQVDVTVDVA